MPRTVKKGEVRKQEILDYALGLFLSKGYDKTSIEDILIKTGIGKGTFYYYFRSKGELLQEVVMYQAGMVIQAIKQIAEKSGLNALEKLNEIAEISVQLDRKNFRQRIELVRIFNSPENLRFSKGLSAKVHNLSLPVIESIINQGILENIFSVNHPHLVADTYLTLTDRFNRRIVELLIDNIENQTDNLSYIFDWINHNQALFEKLLGLDGEEYILLSCMVPHVQNILKANR